MSAKPMLAKLESHATSPQQFYLYPFLKNEGTSTLQPGRLIVKQTSKDGTVAQLSVVNLTPLDPGETTKLIHQVFNPKAFAVVRYEEDGGATYPMEGVINRGILGFSYGGSSARTVMIVIAILLLLMYLF